MTTGNISISELRSAIKGRVIAPGDPEFDEARAVFYGGLDRRPAVIIKAANADDVSQAVSLAKESGLELAVRSGGHSVAGYSATEGGILLNLSDMRAMQIDVEGRTA
jgi:FAD/FMN-containing dehydrogenase